jgi:hypothetical protein
MDGVNEIRPFGDCLYVHEDLLGPKSGGEPVEEASCVPPSVIPAVADEDPHRHGGHRSYLPRRAALSLAIGSASLSCGSARNMLCIEIAKSLIARDNHRLEPGGSTRRAASGAYHYSVLVEHTADYLYVCFQQPADPQGPDLSTYVAVYVDRDNDGG